MYSCTLHSTVSQKPVYSDQTLHLSFNLQEAHNQQDHFQFWMKSHDSWVMDYPALGLMVAIPGLFTLPRTLLKLIYGLYKQPLDSPVQSRIAQCNLWIIHIYAFCMYKIVCTILGSHMKPWICGGPNMCADSQEYG